MKVESKFDIGDTVFYILNNKVNSGMITLVNISVKESFNTTYTDVLYRVNNQDIDYREEKLFPTKEELLKSL